MTPANPLSAADLSKKLVVLGTEQMNDILFGSIYFERNPGDFNERDVAGIIHLSFHDIAAPGAKPLHRFEIPKSLREAPVNPRFKGIAHHFSEVFYGGLQFSELASRERRDAINLESFDGASAAMELGALLDVKKECLRETMDFADEMLSGTDHRRLFIYVMCGDLWAPLLSLAIAARHLGKGREAEAIQLMKQTSPFNQPSLIPAQLAFLDHALARGGALIDAWGADPGSRGFKTDHAKAYHKVFEYASYAYHGPRNDTAMLRRQLRAYNPPDNSTCG